MLIWRDSLAHTTTAHVPGASYIIASSSESTKTKIFYHADDAAMICIGTANCVADAKFLAAQHANQKARQEIAR
jgi:hypothetical protein